MSTAPTTTNSHWQPPPDKLRKELQDEDKFDAKRHDDPTLLRFLRARKFDLVASKAMLLSADQWRKDFGVEELVQNFDFKEREDMNKYYPQYYHKMDKDGRPIYIEHLGNINLTEMYKISTQDRLLQHLVTEYEKSETERLPACSAAVGHPVETYCTILDLAGVGIKKFWDVKGYVSEASKIGQDRYPERMGKFYVINAPFGFSTIWSLIKGWLDPVTQEKIKILGGNYKKDLLDAIDADSLPAELGGTCKCEGGCQLSDAGPWQHEHETGKVEETPETEETIKTGAAA